MTEQPEQRMRRRTQDAGGVAPPESRKRAVEVEESGRRPPPELEDPDNCGADLGGAVGPEPPGGRDGGRVAPPRPPSPVVAENATLQGDDVTPIAGGMTTGLARRTGRFSVGRCTR